VTIPLPHTWVLKTQGVNKGVACYMPECANSGSRYTYGNPPRTSTVLQKRKGGYHTRAARKQDELGLKKATTATLPPVSPAPQQTSSALKAWEKTGKTEQKTHSQPEYKSGGLV